jgi:hypothetical protein
LLLLLAGNGPAAQARSRFLELSEQNGITRPGVPAFLICDQFTIGFDRPETTGEIIRMQLGGGSRSTAGHSTS